jgi:radical SAM protein with 4Fe4S-binding SPASM domain
MENTHMTTSAEWLAVVVVSDTTAPATIRWQVEMFKGIPFIHRVGLMAASSAPLAQDGTLGSLPVDFTISDSWEPEFSPGIIHGRMMPPERRVVVCFSEHALSRQAVVGYLEYHVSSGGGESVFTPGIFETWRVAPLAQAWDLDHLPVAPAPEVEAPLGAITPEVGVAYVARTGRPDLSSHEHRSSATVYEDGVPLGPRNAQHVDIREIGRGRFSFWYDYVYFSASDNSDPRTNGRRYTIRYSPMERSVAPRHETSTIGARLRRAIAELTGTRVSATAVAEAEPVVVAAPLAARGGVKPTFFLGSQRDQLEMLVDRVSEFYPFPRVVNLVLTNLCNLKCVMCPYHSPEYPDLSGYMSTRRYMSEEIFEQVAREAAAKGSWLKMGQLEEVFMHPKLLTFIRKAHNLGVTYMHITTNGTLLNAERSAGLLTSGLTQINVSINAVTPETYKKVHGWDLNKLVKSVEDLLAIRQATGSKTQIFIAMILQDEAVKEEAAFIKFWRGKGADGVIVYQLSEHHHGNNYFRDKYFDHTPPTERHACQSVWQEVYVYPEGEVSTCCTTLILVPQKGLISLGNVTEQSLAEIWKGPEYTGLRKRLIMDDIENDVACKNCDIWHACELKSERRDGYLLEMNPTMAVHSFRR